jgi:tRNA 2-thiouridine synthesizing protein E
MPTVTYEGRHFEVDNKGFLRAGENWNREVAQLFARAQGMESLNDKHWQIIDYIRSYYLEHDKAPLIRAICSACEVSLREIYTLFPKGPVHGACKIAGLAKPDGCV